MALELDGRQVKELLELARSGVHPLFDNSLIRRALEGSAVLDLGRSGLRDVAGAIKEVVTLGTLDEQRAYIATLSPTLQEMLVLMYFRLVDRLSEGESVTLH